MPMSPKAGESKADFLDRCIPDMIGTGADKRPQDQAAAICNDIWRDKDKSMKPRTVAQILKRWRARDKKEFDIPEPEDDESQGDFVDRCISQLTDDGMDEGEAEDACLTQWEDMREEAGTRGIVFKTVATQGKGMEFILSDETPDRYGDIIEVDGWSFKDFKRNPIALFNHNSDFPIGTWDNVRIEGKSLRGELRMAPEGTSDRIDEIRRLIDAGVLRAVSVGFRPLEQKLLDEENKDPWAEFIGPFRFLKSELVETSLVSVPANPNALAVAKSLGISPDIVHLVFGKHAKERDLRDRRRLRASTPDRRSKGIVPGKHAAPSSPNGKGTAMSGLAQRIVDTQNEVNAIRAALEEHVGNLNDDNVSDQDMQKTNELNAIFSQKKNTLDMLMRTEANLAGTLGSGNGNGNGAHTNLPAIRTQTKDKDGLDEAERERRRQYFQATSGKKELQPLDYVVRAGVVTYLARIFGRTPEDICRSYEPYNNDKTRAVVDWNVRTAVNPAMTTVTGWAAELVDQINADYLGLLQPNTIFPRFAARGLQLQFGRAGRINIPMRSATPTIAGSFVGEGLPIPVRRGAFTSQVLTPKKLAVITTWTKELDMHSVPAIEGLLREAISEDTSVAIDSVLLDANPATVIRPAGLLNGVAAIGATSVGGNPFNAIVQDLKNLIGALVTATKGNIRNMVLLANPADLLSAAMTVPPNTGLMPFREEIANGSLVNIPLIDSYTVPVHTLILVDAADFVTVGADGPVFDVSDSATIHEEDTAPAPIVGGTGAGTAATPVRSLWQTDTLALRMIQRLNWVMRRPGMVAWVQNVAW